MKMFAICLTLLVASFTGAAAAQAVVVPAEGAALNFIHVPFRWTALAAVDAYQLQVVEDDASPDPFASGPMVVNLVTSAAQPRALVMFNLAFGNDYAWRVRGLLGGSGLGWGPTHRFSTLPLPASMPPFVVTTGPGSGTLEPGLTLLNTGPGFVVVDPTGQPVWFLERPAAGDIRQLPNGHLLYNSARRAYVSTLDGRNLFLSPDDPDLRVHHEVFPMPNGNLLALTFEYADVLRDGELQPWRGDRIVELDRRTSEVVWDWRSFDHYSTSDFDPEEMEAPRPQDGHYDWTHANGVIYDPVLNSVYISVRHLSRITRIDYATGQVVYNMGKTMPSGDTDFGHDLFSFQHAPEIQPNGNMLLYDNGNRRESPPDPLFTRAIELQFAGGEPPTSASIAWEFVLPEYNRAVGDADRLPGGNTLVVSGFSDHKVHEVSPAGEILWTLEAVDVVRPVYRAERIETLVLDTPGDTDGDWDLDLGDATGFAACFADPAPGPLAFPCTLSDLDADDDVDCSDWEAFKEAWTDPSPPPPLVGCDVSACADGADNDDDGLTDYPVDPGCRNVTLDASESPQCEDGEDNDLDGMIDLADPECAASPAWWDDELAARAPKQGCGLGFELVGLLAALAGLRARRRQPTE